MPHYTPDYDTKLIKGLIPQTALTKLTTALTLFENFYIWVWQNTKVATLAHRTTRAKSTKPNAAITRPCILGQAATELSPAHRLGIVIVQGRLASKVAARVVRTIGHVNFGRAEATNQLATNHSLAK